MDTVWKIAQGTTTVKRMSFKSEKNPFSEWVTNTTRFPVCFPVELAGVSSALPKARKMETTGLWLLCLSKNHMTLITMTSYMEPVCDQFELLHFFLGKHCVNIMNRLPACNLKKNQTQAPRVPCWKPPQCINGKISFGNYVNLSVITIIKSALFWEEKTEPVCDNSCCRIFFGQQEHTSCEY